MTENTTLKTLVERDCRTPERFREMLSTLLIGAYANGVDVSGAWEAHEDGTAPEWDVVVTMLEREREEERDP